MKFKYVQLCGHRGHPMANKNGVILEHRLVMSKAVGRNLKSSELVHHKNEKQNDNELTNLELTTKDIHIKKHFTKKPKMVLLKCSFCKSIFKRRWNQIITKKKKGQKDFYCTRKCMGHHQKNNKKGKVANSGD